MFPSREYKIPLRVNTPLDELGDDINFIIPIKWPNKFKTREVLFLDTPEYDLRKRGYLYRIRDSRRAYLKFRSPDMCEVLTNRMIGDKEVARIKLEEDILPPFRSRFSISARIKCKGDAPPEKVGHIEALFPCAVNVFPNREARLFVVNDRRVQEEVHKSKTFRIGDEKAMASIVIWSVDNTPVVSELSFRYQNGKGEYSNKTVMAAQFIFTHMQALPWCSPTTCTKTQWIYGEASWHQNLVQKQGECNAQG